MTNSNPHFDSAHCDVLWLTGLEEHEASLPDDSRWDGYDRGDLDYVGDDGAELPPWVGCAGYLGEALSAVAQHMAWERSVTAREVVAARSVLADR